MRSQTTDVADLSCRRGPTLTILLCVALLALAGPAAASEQQPRFYLERLAVEGVSHASPAVIVSESLLEGGIAYTEAELLQAMYRVKRLPFVLDAGFSLGKGSERGRYSLLITVEEVRRFFLGSDLGYTAQGGALRAASAQDDGLTETLSAGARVFAGQGVFFAAVGDGENLQAGYERYRLFDRPILLRLAYAREGCCSANLQELGLDPGAAVWRLADEADRLELTIGIPLAANHSLRLDASSLETDSATRRTLDGSGAASLSEVEQRELELAWVFDSTDDPVFPSRGDALTAAVSLRWLEGDLSRPPAPPPAVEEDLRLLVPGTASEMSSQLVGLSLFGARHWPLSGRQTVSLSLKLLASRSEVDNLPRAPVDGAEPAEASGGGAATLPLWSGDVDAFEADLGMRYSVGLWGPRNTHRLGELRWETLARLIYVETSPALSPSAHPLWGVSLHTGIALRNTWGIFRIGFTYLDFDGEL